MKLSKGTGGWPLVAVLVAGVLALACAGSASASPSSPYVVGGRDASAADFPWQVTITANGTEFCGGALIHPRIVLTAAHCLIDAEGRYFEDVAGLEFRAFTGQTQIGVGGEELDWRISRVHPGYDPATETYDWGFVTLAAPASAPTIQIAGPDERPLWRTGRQATVTGFGDLSDGGPSSAFLQRLAVPILADSGCSGYIGFDPSSMLCAGYLEGGKDACQGDSGGPLSVTADHGVRRLVGLVSTGHGCALPGYPGIYSRVADPAIGDVIQQEVEAIERQDGFPAELTGIDVVGSGASPLGCATRLKSRKAAGQRVKSNARQLKSARRSGKRNRIAVAKRRLAKAKSGLKRSRESTRKACL